VLVVVVAAVVALVPGLADVRDGLARASPGWLALAAGLEVLSCLAYVVAFRAAFCARMTWRMSYRIGMSALGAASVLPVGGVGGLALGAWALRRGGLALERIARRTVAFFLITSATNVAAVIVVGGALALGVLPGTESLLLSAGPVVFAIAAVLFATLARAWSGHWCSTGRRGRPRQSGSSPIVPCCCGSPQSWVAWRSSR
jgi:hypothetical protein